MKYLYVLLVAVLPQCLMAGDDLVKKVKETMRPETEVDSSGWRTYLFKTKKMSENDFIWSSCDPRFSGVPSKAFGKYLYNLHSLKPTKTNLEGKSAAEVAFVKYAYDKKPKLHCCGVAVKGTDTLAFPVFTVPTAGNLDDSAQQKPFYLLVKGRGANRSVKVVRKQDAKDAVAALDAIVTRGMKDAFIPSAIKIEVERRIGKLSLKMRNSVRLEACRKKALAEYRTKLDEVIAKYKAKPDNKFGPKWILKAKADLQFVKDGFVPRKFIMFSPKKNLTALLYASAFPKTRHYLPPSRYELELGKDLGRKTPIATARSWANAYYSDNPKRVYEYWEVGALNSRHDNAFLKEGIKIAGKEALRRMMIFSELYTTIDKVEYCILPVRMESPAPKPVYYLRLNVFKKVGHEWLRTTDLNRTLYKDGWFDPDWDCRTEEEYDAKLAKWNKYYLHFDKLYPAYSSRWDDWRFSRGSVDADEGEKK